MGSVRKSSSIFAIGTPEGLQIVEETLLPGSLRVLYMMMTAYLGFKPLDGEYKVMGLASYGDARTYANKFEDLFERQPDGTCLTTALVRADFGEYIEGLFGPASRRPLVRSHDARWISRRRYKEASKTRSFSAWRI